ncbi:unnamed protein product [Enterobius vermicularis]|uniref:C-type lectin domain-containing protein n=1 Tax=Enterobius vermicularis TaxID=51028 RepID=A0A0N4V289_ENTVE|nr:unnamed protein product [Enterobius vermicularis]
MCKRTNFASLLTVDSQAEQSFAISCFIISSYVTRYETYNYQIQSLLGFTYHKYWIALRRSGSGWVWENGRPLTYSNFGGGGSGDCVMSINRRWTLMNCRYISPTTQPATRPPPLRLFLATPLTCQDRVGPNGRTDCSERRSFCNDRIYYHYISYQCPRTCNRCWLANTGAPSVHYC